MRKLTRLHRRQHRRNTSELSVEIARVSRACDLWDKGRRDALVVNIVPINVPKECVAHNLLGVGWARAKSELGLASQQLLENRD